VLQFRSKSIEQDQNVQGNDQVELFVRALEKDERPAESTLLKTAPYWKLDSAGRVCLGSMRVPDDGTVASIASWESGFFRSEFTHPNGAVRLTSHPHGFLGLWKGLKNSESAFPVEFLTEANETLLQFVER
jgi:PRTRC genetic system protein B